MKRSVLVTSSLLGAMLAERLPDDIDLKIADLDAVRGRDEYGITTHILIAPDPVPTIVPIQRAPQPWNANGKRRARTYKRP